MDDTLAEVDLDEWNNAFVGAMTKQLTTLYTEKDVKGKDKVFKVVNVRFKECYWMSSY